MRNSRTKVVVCLIVLVSLFAQACNKNKKKRTNWNVTLKEREGTKPYDFKIAWKSLDYYFPDATKKLVLNNFVFENIGENDYYTSEGESLLVLTGRSIYFSQREWQGVIDFMKKGNEVLMLSSDFDERMKERFHFSQKSGDEIIPLSKQFPGSRNENILGLEAFPNERFGFWGRDISGYFIFEGARKSSFDSLGFSQTEFGQPLVLGTVFDAKVQKRQPNFIRFNVGEGHLTLLASPLLLSNYFLLQSKNRKYSDQIWQSVPKEIFQIYWGNFYQRSADQSSFSILWRHPATRWAIIFTLFTGIIYLIFQMKRRQRVIPILPEPVNSSAAFIETVGMLYFNKGDNTNLAIKMEQHFLDWVRTRFNINTNLLNETFARQLSVKSGKPIDQVQNLVNMMHELRMSNVAVSDDFLFNFYHTIQDFYKSN